MAKIAFLLLCHKDPDAVVRQAESLTAGGACVAIHFDAAAPRAQFDRLRMALSGNTSVAFARRRIRCGWGDWSLVRATLETARTALERFEKATHFYLISGDCRPIRPAVQVIETLTEKDRDFIETADFHHGNWIKTGLRAERLDYWHLFNERHQPRRFYGAMALQRGLGLRRSPPRDLDIRIGSQWWCLRRRTLEALFDLLARRRDILRFFRFTWIPDEIFFQTLVAHLVPESEIANRPPTFVLFSDYGLPVTFHDDHRDFLLRQDALFVRKISPRAAALRTRLEALFAEPGQPLAVTGTGPAQYRHITGLGRRGYRISPRAWDRAGTLDPGCSLRVLVVRPGALATRLVHRIAGLTGVPNVGFLFSDGDVALPALGGIATSLDKRNRHRPSVLRLLLAHFGTRDLLICVDPGDRAALEDLAGITGSLRFLLVDAPSTPGLLAGRARARGLVPADAPDDAVQPMLALLRAELAQDLQALRELAPMHLSELRADDTAARRAEALAQFLSIPQDKASRIADAPDLFDDEGFDDGLCL